MRAEKPAKPYKDFPLTAHPAGVWCKKIKGKLHNFGGWSDPEAALVEYRRVVDELQAGRPRPPKPEDVPDVPEQFTMLDLVNDFLDAKKIQVDSGRMSPRLHQDYRKICGRLLEIAGKNTVVENLKPRDFDGFAAKLMQSKGGPKTGGRQAKKTVGIVTFGNRVRMSLAVFRFASKRDLIPKPLKFGENFAVPGKKDLRSDRQSRPKKEFAAEDLRLIIDKAKSPLKAMILLGINAGFGQTDCANLPKSAIDLKSGWIDFPRKKTAIERRCPLWPETAKALKAAIASRPEPSSSEFSELVFVTKYGNQFVRIDERGTRHDAVALEFGKIMKALGMAGNDRGFYSLRRTFETIGGASLDQIAVDHVMGHSPPADDMAAVYRQHLTDERLRAVVDHVHAWLFPPKKSRRKAKTTLI